VTKKRHRQSADEPVDVGLWLAINAQDGGRVLSIQTFEQIPVLLHPQRVCHSAY